MNVLIAGTTGLIGNHLLQYLLQTKEICSVTALLRQKIDIEDEKLNQLVFDFNEISSYEKLDSYDAVFCCLGTTIKVAKTKENFLKVDFEYPLKLAKQVKTKQFHLVSSMGADANSSVFYSQTKGKIEQELQALNIETLYIYRPAMLTGKRKEFRLVERIFEPLQKALNIVTPKNYRLIAAKTVAKAMQTNLLINQKGNYLYLSDHIKKIAANDN